MQKTKTAKKGRDNSEYKELPFFKDRRVDSVKRNFAIGIDRGNTSIPLSNGPSQLRKGLNRN